MSDEPIYGADLPDDLRDAFRDFARAANMLWPAVARRIAEQSPRTAGEMHAYFGLGGSMRLIVLVAEAQIEFQILDSGQQWRTFYTLTPHGASKPN